VIIMGERPPWMEKVAEAGGWEEARKLREQKELMETMAKIPPESWQNIKYAVQGLNRFVEVGGTKELLSSFTEEINTTITSIVNEALSPITNAINQAIGEAMKPVLDQLNPIINQISQFISGNVTGGVIGAISGGIIGSFLGSPILGSTIGALLGSLIELGLTTLAQKYEDYETRIKEEGGWMWVWGPGGYIKVWVPGKDTQTTDLPLHGYIKELE